ARGLFPLPSQNCPRGRGEGSLTEAAGSAGSPVPEAMSVMRTTGRIHQKY
ncbi:hypothetical protein DBR06_SOUSAS27110002, partial [Sousa chinensis]